MTLTKRSVRNSSSGCYVCQNGYLNPIEKLSVVRKHSVEDIGPIVPKYCPICGRPLPRL